MLKKFIERPVLAIVLSLVILILGVISISTMSIEQFPSIAPPRVEVDMSYPGASAKVLTDNVLIPLEQSINGVQDMKYMTSDATTAGEGAIQVIFNLGTDMSQALVNVQNRVNMVASKLPKLVNLEGIFVYRLMPNMLMYVNLYSDDPHATQNFLYNYAYVNLYPELYRTPGIARETILGTRTFAMRIWLKPDRMRAYDVSAQEVMDALDEQSVIANAGRIGRSDTKQSQAIEYVLDYPGRFQDVSQYENVIIRAKPDGEILHLKDVADVQLGGEFYDLYSNLDGKPAASIMLNQTAGSNAKVVIAQIKDKLTEMSKSFPPGLHYKIGYDVSSFLDASIHDVLETLYEAFVLVALVVFVFLGDWRSTLIPTLAVPISLVGAFTFMNAFGLTINMISLFALVLAIGIVVDDAIVMVEAVHAKMAVKHCSPLKAVKEVVGELSGAIIAITLLMTSVFVPVAFMPGPTGLFYRQFSITMATSIVLSGTVALTLTPVLCALILKKHDPNHKRSRNPINLFLDAFNRVFEKVTNFYVSILSRIVNRWLVTVVMIGAFVAGLVWVMKVLPSGFIPTEDQGMIYAVIQTPPGTTLERTNKVVTQLQQICEKEEGVASVSQLAGYEILSGGRGSNSGTCLINLKPWDERKKTEPQIIEDLEVKTRALGAIVELYEPPAVSGYGNVGGWSVRLLDKTNTMDYKALGKVNDDFLAALKKRPEVTGVFSFYTDGYPFFMLKIDNNLAMQKGVSIGNALNNLSIMIGSTYDIGFIKFGRYFKVYVQAGAQYRRLPSDLLKLYVKNDRGQQVPYSAFMKLVPTHDLAEITRYNMYPSSAIKGKEAAGYSSQDAMNAIKEVAKQTLPKGYDIGWEQLSRDQDDQGNTAPLIFGLVILFVYLVLSAQYESFIMPFAVICSLPAGIFGAFFFCYMLGVQNDIYAQVGLVMLVGLLGKNAVLIVEYAIQVNKEAGLSIYHSAIEAARMRFRPILMTSFAFVAGLLPLIFAHGPGAIGDRTIGAASVGGMLFGTVFGVFVIPGLYFIFGTMASKRHMLPDEEDDLPLSEELENHPKNEE